jgi:hypothetical protein
LTNLTRNTIKKWLKTPQRAGHPPQDSACRITGIAIDHSEFARLDDAAIAHVVAVMQRFFGRALAA